MLSASAVPRARNTAAAGEAHLEVAGPGERLLVHFSTGLGLGLRLLRRRVKEHWRSTESRGVRARSRGASWSRDALYAPHLRWELGLREVGHVQRAVHLVGSGRHLPAMGDAWRGVGGRRQTQGFSILTLSMSPDIVARSWRAGISAGVARRTRARMMCPTQRLCPTRRLDFI